MTMGATTGALVARTTAGDVAGVREGALTVFRGVPYARPPLGELRFSSPRMPVPWTGVRDATRYAPAFLQSGAAGPGSSEDALYANVWTPGTDRPRPVLVYIHGGGWQVGAGSVPTFHGHRLAERGDLVVVNFNYRLGVFGWGMHEELADPATGLCANWGLQDQIAALHWVRENIAAFGGDPDNITLCGTSAGGTTAWQLALLPEFHGTVRRLIAISAAHPWQPAGSLTPADAHTVYGTLAADLGTTVPGLREVPAEALHQAWLRFFSAAPAARPVDSGREYRGPVADGGVITAFPWQLPTPAVPLMTVFNRTEGSFFTDPHSVSFPPAPPVPTDHAELRDRVREVLLKGAVRVDDALVDACLSAYREAARAERLPHDPRTLWTEIWGDGLFRYQIVRMAERHARTRGASPQYVMEFAHPVRPPHFGTPHDATSKFLFGSHAEPGLVDQFGDGPDERLVSRTFMDLVASFARDGAPAAGPVPHWPVFDPDRETTLILGGPGTARVAALPKLRQLGFWDRAGWVPSPRPADPAEHTPDNH
ncbi:carboxylesterase/lipase family protein [Streptomyces aidingensis]|uniref:Carboxylic ester hydrolase n=1 Tax=Streptomyces aidingensis TaxID=910347 RepID=A0A1I1FFK3_9ACTN|nr:carboxylesterase family protein [Streptomyces aidingensis]SFB98187.1 para-nitrobenzyl esterase [Streptomyces aidingensis]